MFTRSVCFLNIKDAILPLEWLYRSVLTQSGFMFGNVYLMDYSYEAHKSFPALGCTRSDRQSSRVSGSRRQPTKAPLCLSLSESSRREMGSLLTWGLLKTSSQILFSRERFTFVCMEKRGHCWLKRPHPASATSWELNFSCCTYNFLFSEGVIFFQMSLWVDRFINNL